MSNYVLKIVLVLSMLFKNLRTVSTLKLSGCGVSAVWESGETGYRRMHLNLVRGCWCAGFSPT